MMLGTPNRRRFAALALLVALAGPAGAFEPEAAEDEIKARTLFGAEGNLHLFHSPSERSAARSEWAEAGDPACR